MLQALKKKRVPTLCITLLVVKLFYMKYYLYFLLWACVLCSKGVYSQSILYQWRTAELCKTIGSGPLLVSFNGINTNFGVRNIYSILALCPFPNTIFYAHAGIHTWEYCLSHLGYYILSILITTFQIVLHIFE